MKKTDNRVVCLVSGGLDSTVMYYLLQHKGYEVTPLYVNYGQKVAGRELNVLRRYGIPAVVLNSPMQDIYKMRFRGYKPLRNHMFVSVASAWGFLNRIYKVAVGLTVTDHETIPDMSRPFFDSLEDTISIGMGKKIRILTPFADKNKTDIVRIGHKLRVDVEDTWSCFMVRDKECGKCKSCVKKWKAIEEHKQCQKTR